jgi:AbiJ N-terminal domain 5
MVNHDLAERILALRGRVVANFDAGDWEEVGLLTGFSELIDRHPRLLRSLSWGDEDYAGNVLTIIKSIAQQNAEALSTFEKHVTSKYPDESQFISAKTSERKITFAPNAFRVPENTNIETDLVALMMPFNASFASVHESIKRACASSGYRCLRVDDIWEESTVIQDIFNLIFRAHIVVVDFTGKNPNVMYETGIAHTLGKHVVPISQSLDDVPFDITHHRILKYLPNTEGLSAMQGKLADKLQQVSR